jgi:hypothetical protein
MNTYLIASMRENAGKTSFIIGLAAARQKRYGYLKPFGDRLVYHRKKNSDHDASVIVKLWGLDCDPDSVTLGFNHAKLRYVHDEESLRRIVGGKVEDASRGMDGLFIEGGKDICYGASVFLDSLSLAGSTGAEIIIVASGEPDTLMDDLHFMHSYFDMSECTLRGVVINKVRDPDDFKDSFVKHISDMGIPVLGVIPYEERLTHHSMRYLADALFAKVLGGEGGLGNVVRRILVGAMSTEALMRSPLFNYEDKLIITSGDRDDMIVAALDSATAGIILTNCIIPPSKIISHAEERGVPLLLVANDTFHTAKLIDGLEALVMPEDERKISLLTDLVKEHVAIEEL